MPTIRVEMMKGRGDWATGAFGPLQLMAFCLHDAARD